MTEEQKKAFDTYYNSRRDFSERHIKLAENLDHEKWLKNELFRYYEKGFQAANVWHNLRKDLHDLPDHSCMLLVYTGCQGVELTTFNVNTRRFGDSTLREVVAWCELPEPPEDPE